LLLVWVGLLAPDLMVWFSRGGPFTPESSRWFWGSVPDWSVLLWFPSPAVVITFFTLFAAAAFCLMIGFWTRWSALLVFLGLVSIGHRNPLILNGGDTVIRLMAFYLVLSPCGAALSVDRLRALARGKATLGPALAPPWAQRLLQLQIAFVYACTVLLKLKGQSWSNGTAIYTTSWLEEFDRFPLPFVFQSMTMVNIMTYWTLATEIAMAFLVWIPVLRPFVLLNGVLLHGGIEYTMNIPLFAFTMIISYVAFVNVEAIWQKVRALQPLRALPRATLSAGALPPAFVPALRVLQGIDILRRVEIAGVPWSGRPEAAPESFDGAFGLRTTTGREYEGVAACRWLACRLPLLWPVAPLLYLPGTRWVLDAVFDRFVDHEPAARGLPIPLTESGVTAPAGRTLLPARAAGRRRRQRHTAA